MIKVGRKLETKILALEANARETLDFLLKQFTEPEMCYRELVQNSLDAESPRIDVSFNYTPNVENPDAENADLGRLEIVVEDYGKGMTLSEKDDYLTRLFASSKEGDLRKIGKFGIGFVSVFTLNPDEVVVESSKDQDNWRLVIDKDFSSKVFENEARKGTKVKVIFNEISKRKVYDMELKANAIIKDQCCLVKAPIYISGKEINEPFDIKNAIARVYFTDPINGIEGVIGLTETPHYNLLNNRLSIKKKENESIIGHDNLSVLVSSRELRYNLSRNDVLQDKHYGVIFGTLNAAREKLLEEIFREIAKRANKIENPPIYDSKNPDQKKIEEEYEKRKKQREILWEFGYNELAAQMQNRREKARFGYQKKTERVIPATILNAKIFPAFSENVAEESSLSLADIIKEPGSEIYSARRRSTLVEILMKQGKKVLIEDELGKKFLERMEKEIGKSPKDAEHLFYIPDIILEDSLTDEERKFVKLVVEGVKETDFSKRYRGILFGRPYGSYLSSESLGIPLTFVNDSSLNSLAYMENEQLNGGFIGQKRHVLLYRNNPTIIQLMRLSKIKPELAQYLTLKLIVTSDYDSKKDYSKHLFDMYKNAANKESEGITSGGYHGPR